MTEVFVVRQFFEGCSDTGYIGVYTDFWKAAQASIAVILEEDEEWVIHADLDEYLPPSERSQVWLENAVDGQGCGTYYAIDRLGLE